MQQTHEEGGRLAKWPIWQMEICNKKNHRDKFGLKVSLLDCRETRKGWRCCWDFLFRNFGTQQLFLYCFPPFLCPLQKRLVKLGAGTIKATFTVTCESFLLLIPNSLEAGKFWDSWEQVEVFGIQAIMEAGRLWSNMRILNGTHLFSSKYLFANFTTRLKTDEQTNRAKENFSYKMSQNHQTKGGLNKSLW